MGQQLERRIHVTAHAADRVTGRGWVQTFAVCGMAGAVSLDVMFARPTEIDRDSEDGWKNFHSYRTVYRTDGLRVHAFRSTGVEYGAGEEESCPLLDGRRCFCVLLDNGHYTQSSRMVEDLTTHGPAPVWLALEDVYREQFVPAESPEQIASRESMERAAAIAEEPVIEDSPGAGVLGESALLTHLPGHVFAVMQADMGDGQKFWLTCSCSWSSESRDHLVEAVKEAERHVEEHT